jgi:hypothetical protein
MDEQRGAAAAPPSLAVRATHGVLAWSAWLVLGAVIGVAATAWVWQQALQWEPVVAGWQHRPALAQTAHHPWARARRAAAASVAPDADQVWALYATTDETGALLDGRCSYTLTGPPPPAVAWSLYAYDRHGEWLGTALASPGAAAPQSGLLAAQVPGMPEGTPWHVQTRPDGALTEDELQRPQSVPASIRPWALATPSADGLVLVMRLHRPNAQALAHPLSWEAWRISRVGGCE